MSEGNFISKFSGDNSQLKAFISHFASCTGFRFHIILTSHHIIVKSNLIVIWRHIIFKSHNLIVNFWQRREDWLTCKNLFVNFNRIIVKPCNIMVTHAYLIVNWHHIFLNRDDIILNSTFNRQFAKDIRQSCLLNRHFPLNSAFILPNKKRSPVD